MTVTSEHLKDGQRLPPTRRSLATNKIAAVLAWSIGAAATYTFFARVMPGSSWLLAALLAVGVQGILTCAERPLWRFITRRNGGRFVVLGVVVTLLDGALNAAGAYPFMSRVVQTDLGLMIAEVFRVEAAIDPTGAFILALAGGLLLAGLPEYLWYE